MSEIETIRSKYDALRAGMNESVCRRWAASEALALGRGGMTLVAKATGLSVPTIRRGLRELKTGASLSVDRVRGPGGGRKKVTAKDETVLRDLEALVAPSARGDPMSPLRWTCKSTTRLAAELQRQGHAVSTQTVWALLRSLGYSLQSNRKVREGTSHLDRDAQFEHINARVEEFQRNGQPVISVDTKKELVGDFKSAGREWHPKGQPELVRVHDFIDEELGKAIPYGVYDVTANAGWVSMGIDHDTPAFAVESIRQWWRRMGKSLYPHASELLITADGGGSNVTHSRLWKVALQRLADEEALSISVCHFPPGTSKWNKIEHRMFYHITQNWRGRPLVSLQVIVSLIASTTTQKGLRIRARVDRHTYPTGIEVTQNELSKIRLEQDSFHGEWNYRILPRKA